MILRQCLFCTRHTPRPSQLCNKILYKTNEYRYCSENNNFGWLWFQFFKKRGTKGCVPIIVVSYCLALYVWKFTPESWKWGFNELLNLRSRRSNVGSILAMEQLTSYLPLWACWGGGGSWEIAHPWTMVYRGDRYPVQMYVYILCTDSNTFPVCVELCQGCPLFLTLFVTLWTRSQGSAAVRRFGILGI